MVAHCPRGTSEGGSCGNVAALRRTVPRSSPLPTTTAFVGSPFEEAFVITHSARHVHRFTHTHRDTIKPSSTTHHWRVHMREREGGGGARSFCGLETCVEKRWARERQTAHSSDIRSPVVTAHVAARFGVATGSAATRMLSGGKGFHHRFVQVIISYLSNWIASSN
jgi:hypothetical protein